MNRRTEMADQKTVEKVKALLETNVYGPLKDAAEKWLEVADEKYDVKDMAAKAKDKLDDAVDAVKDAADKLQDSAGPAFENLKEKAGPTIDKLQDAAEPYLDKLQDAAEPYLDKIQGKAEPTLEKIRESELIKQLKDGISTLTDNIELFGSEKGAEIVGSKEAAEQIKKHAEAMKAEGKTFCDCEACTKAREILRDLGEDIGE